MCGRSHARDEEDVVAVLQRARTTSLSFDRGIDDDVLAEGLEAR